MRRALLILMGVFILLAAGSAVFIATFDADRYRPLLVRRLEEATGRSVELSRLSLGWRRGIALELRGLAIREDRESALEPLIQVESASALVELMPLLRRELRVSSIVLDRPRIHVTRDAQGAVDLTGLTAAADRGGTIPAAEEVPRRDGAAAAPAGAAAAPSGESAPVSLRIASFRIQDGALHWTDLATHPPTDLQFSSVDAAVTNIAPGQPMAVNMSGAVTGDTPNLRLTARLVPPDARQPGSLQELELSLTRVPLERLLPAVPAGEPSLRGMLTMTIAGNSDTLDPAALMRAVSGRGTLTLGEPVVVNLNVLRAVFEQLSVLPGLLQALEARLPSDYQAKLAARDTALKPIELTVQAEAGRLRCDDLAVRSDTFGLSGRGTIDVDGAINVQAQLRIEPQLSAAIIRSVNELAALANPQGELELPLTVQGTAPRIAVRPDLQYVASRVVVRKAADFLGELLREDQPAEPPADQPAPESSAGTDRPAPTTGELLGRLLKRALEPDPPPQ